MDDALYAIQQRFLAAIMGEDANAEALIVDDARVGAARRIGITPFCVTIDRAGGAYLPHLFGQDGFLMISDPERLPERLPKLYAELSGL